MSDYATVHVLNKISYKNLSIKILKSLILKRILVTLWVSKVAT